jgi:hypothetical protein
MKAILEINVNELNANFLKVVRDMFEKNVTEIVLKPQTIVLEEFDKSMLLDDVITSLKDKGHSAEFLAEIKDGLENSSIYNNHEG